MNNSNLGKVTEAVFALVETKSDKQLYSRIAETAKSLGKADYVKLVLFENEHLKRFYLSDDTVKKHKILVNKNVIKLVSSRMIVTIAKTDVERLQIMKFPLSISFEVIVPIFNSENLFGYIQLYYRKNKENPTAEEKEILRLYSHTAAMVLNRIKLKEESQKALEIRDRFISLASHELRTPLTSIHGYIQLLHSRMKDKDTIESRWTNELYIESIRLTTLVKELLDVNRIKQGQFAFVFSEVPLQEVVTRAIDRYRLTNSNHPFIFHCKLTNHETRIVGDFDKLVEMVSGLLGNAVKFSKPDEKIIVTLRNTNNMLSLEVKNKGKGISKKDLVAIQNGFYKPEYANFIEGMGVGIMLARHIIENHRGKLNIKSKENIGTTVTVHLPAMKSAK
jgi:signal transduction histidine kinase